MLLIKYNHAIKIIIKEFKNLKVSQKIILSLILIIIFIKNIFTSNLNILEFDEAWNYRFFLNQPVYFNFLSHNNYPLNNVATKFFISFLGNSEIVIRLFANLMTLIGSVVVFYLTHKKFKRFDIAIASLFIFIFSPIILTYCAISKGVVPYFVFQFPIYFMILKYFKQGNFNKFQWLNFTILNLFATLSSISHCSFMVTINLIILIFTWVKQRAHFIKTCKYLFVYSIISIIPIIPFLFVNNISAPSINYFNVFYKNAFQAFAGYSKYIYFNWVAVLFVLCLNFYLFIYKKKFFAAINIIIFLLPISISLLTKYLLVDRFYYYILIIQFSSLIYLITKIKNKFIFYFCIIAYISYAIFDFNLKHKNIFSKQYDIEAKMIIEKINKNKYNQILFSSSTYVYPNLAIEHYSKLQNPNFKVNLNNINSSRYDSFENHQLYPLIIVDTNKYQKIKNFQRVAILSGEAELWEKVK